jgi:hypothetical protein
MIRGVLTVASPEWARDGEVEDVMEESAEGMTEGKVKSIWRIRRLHRIGVSHTTSMGSLVP